MDYWSLVLVGPTGFVETIINEDSEQIEQIVYKSLKRILFPVPTEEQEEKPVPTPTSGLGKGSWIKFEDFFSNLSSVPKDSLLPYMFAKAECTRTYHDGVTTWEVEPLKMYFATTKEEEPRDRQLSDKMVSSFDRSEYTILPAATRKQSEDYDYTFRLNCETVQALLDRSSLKSELTLVSQYELDLCGDLQWKRVSQDLKPNITYLGPENAVKKQKFVFDLE